LTSSPRTSTRPSASLSTTRTRSRGTAADSGQKVGYRKLAQTAIWEITPVKSFQLYRECTGAARLCSKVKLIAGAFPIRRLVMSR
jgi:hypothetical protein